MNFNFNGFLTYDNILSRVSPLNIFKAYSKNFIKQDLKFKSDFGEDKNPSAIVYYYNGTYLYRDFRDDFAMNCFQFTSRKYGLDFKSVLEKINNDFSLGLNGQLSSGKIFTNINNHSQSEIQHKTIIEIKKRNFNNDDLIWWNNQSWTHKMLKAAKINPITHFRLTSSRKDIDKKLFICDDYSYSMDYYWNNDIFRRKLYFPKKESHRKWVSNVDNTIVQGWELLPKNGEILFIASSFKDCGPMWRIFRKPTAIAPNNEGGFIPDSVFYKLKQRYKMIIIYFDNDDVGIKKAMKFSKIYKIPYIHNPLGSPKDQSDFWKLEGGREFNYYLQKNLNLINERY